MWKLVHYKTIIIIMVAIVIVHFVAVRWCPWTHTQGCKCCGLGRNSGLEKIRFFSFRLGKILFV
jgi:hypothetical protein